MTTHAAPVGGPLWTKTFKLMLGLFGLACVLILYRFATGLGASTAMNDRYPWGIWIAYDVVTGTALACGGYAVAILVYVLNKGQYHPLIRSAIVTSALGYSLGGASVVMDLGRWWNVWKVPTHFWSWNFTSVLLEVALCIMTYTCVLWIEALPAFLEKAAEGNGGLAKASKSVLPALEKVMPFLIALGVLLPTMHQSSLGSLMLLSGIKLHPLWQTPILPLLFLVSCICMGYGAVVIESSLSSHFFGLPRETHLLRRLGRVIAPLLILYLTLRLTDLAVRGNFGLIFTSGVYSLLFLIEMVLFITPIVLIYRDPVPSAGTLFRVAMSVVFAGGLYRFSTFLIAFRPAPGWVYFPSIMETLITTGLIAGEVAAFIFLTNKFPILQPKAPRPRGRTGFDTASANGSLPPARPAVGD